LTATPSMALLCSCSSWQRLRSSLIGWPASGESVGTHVLILTSMYIVSVRCGHREKISLVMKSPHLDTRGGGSSAPPPARLFTKDRSRKKKEIR
jgi:hypothetical protein